MKTKDYRKTFFPRQFWPKKKPANLAVVFSLVLCFAFFSCISQEDSNTKKAVAKKDTLNFDVSLELSCLNPHEIKFSGSTFAYPLLYSPLASTDSKGNLRQGTAKSWFYDEHKRQWTIHLEENARFHDGRSIMPEDVVYSLKEILKNHSGHVSGNIKRLVAVSPLSLEIHLKEDDPDLMKKIWDTAILPSPEGRNIDYCNAPVGSGPYVFEHRKGNNEICLVANSEYYGTKPSIRRVCFHYVPDKEETWARLLRGDTDAAPDVTPENVTILKTYEDRFHFNQFIINHYSLVLYNTKLELFSKPEVRQALTLSIDRKRMVEQILGGLGEIASGPLGNGSPFHVPDAVPIFEYDPQRAIFLLQRAGWRPNERGLLIDENGKPFEFSLFFQKEDPLDREVAEFIQLAWNDIGITARLISLPCLDLLERFHYNDEFQAVVTETGSTYRRPEVLKMQWVVDPTRGCSGLGCFENPRIDQLIRFFLEEKTLDARRKLGVEIEKAFREIHPATFLFHKASMDIMSKRIDFPLPFSLDANGIIRLRFARFAKD